MKWNITFHFIYFSIEAFVLEMQTEYSKLDLWMKNAEIADSLLMEYDPYADQPEKLGTTITAVRLQLHENQVCIVIQTWTLVRKTAEFRHVSTSLWIETTTLFLFVTLLLSFLLMLSLIKLQFSTRLTSCIPKWVRIINWAMSFL